MNKEVENKNSYKVLEDNSIGDVQIADEVISIIASLAAEEVEGVASMSGNVTYELVAMLGGKKISKGVKVLVDSKAVSVELALIVKYGYSIPKISEKVQERVKQSIENMTGLQVEEVNIRIAGVKEEK